MKYSSRTIGIVGLVVVLWFSVFSAANAEISIAYRTNSPLLKFAVGRLDQSLYQIGHTPAHYDLTALAQKTDILITADDRETTLLQRLTGTAAVTSSIKKEGFQILKLRSNNKPMLCIIARDEIAAMYGTLDLAEQIRIKGSLENVNDKLSNPRFGFRAIKFNLPWSSYRTSEALQLHTQTCRDLKFWQRFLDMMAENRFNVLSLWNWPAPVLCTSCYESILHVFSLS